MERRGSRIFPQQIGSGFRFDTTPADVVAEMTSTNARIQSLARVLNASSNPTSDKIVMNSAMLEGARKNYDGDQYFMILNMSSKTLSGQAVSLPGLSGLSRVDVFGEGRDLSLANGQLVDQFDPWEMHVYHADLAGFGILAASAEEIDFGGSAGGAGAGDDDGDWVGGDWIGGAEAVRGTAETAVAHRTQLVGLLRAEGAVDLEIVVGVDGAVVVEVALGVGGVLDVVDERGVDAGEVVGVDVAVEIGIADEPVGDENVGGAGEFYSQRCELDR
jgi:hypothetical protein